jgi:hypothetical protein
MEIITVVKKGPSDRLITYAFSTLQAAIDTFPIIGTYSELLFEIESPYGMTINNREININVKKCFVFN